MSGNGTPIVKICGLSTVEHAHVAAVHGASLLGFIFAPSRRQVDAATVSAVRAGLGGILGELPPFVGVFVDPRGADLDGIVATAGLDLVQLSGDESPSIADDFDVPYIRAVRIGMLATAADALREADRWMSLVHPPEWLLVDAAVPGSYGGSGQLANWEVARQVAGRYPTLLAGGLDADNVALGLESTRAAGVDVSSGVEENGAKSAARIARFIAAARAAPPGAQRTFESR